MFAYDFDDPGFQPDYLEPDTLEAIRGNVGARQLLQSEYQQIEEDVRILRNEVLRNAKQNCPLPVNLRRLIWNAQKLFSCKPHKPGPAGRPPCKLSFLFWQNGLGVHLQYELGVIDIKIKPSQLASDLVYLSSCSSQGLPQLTLLDQEKNACRRHSRVAVLQD